jgi:hypothetical protein
LFQNQVKLQRQIDHHSNVTRSENYRRSAKDPAAKAEVNELYAHLQTMPIYEGLLEQNEKKRSSFHVAHDNTVPICHVTSCPPSRLRVYKYNEFMKHDKYVQYFEDLTANQQRYILEEMDGNLCLIPEWKLMLPYTGETEQDRRDAVVSYLDIWIFDTFTLLLTICSKSGE